MADQITIELPKDTSPADIDAIQTALKQLPDVKGAGVYKQEGLRLRTSMLWVKLAATALPVIAQIVDMLRKKMIQRASITLPSGLKVDADKATVEEIQQLLKSAEKGAAKP